MTITHIFFNLAGTLVDPARLRSCYAEQLGQVMAERFGGSADRWTQARLKILADWDSYFSDLNFDGDSGLDDLWEGELRITRALFRLTCIPEPDSQTLATLARELPYLAGRKCDVLYPDSKPAIETLYGVGYTLGMATYSISPLVRGVLEGAGVSDYFRGPFLCPDVIEHFRKDRPFFRAAHLPPENSLVVDHDIEGIHGAAAAGMQTVHLIRDQKGLPSPADHILNGDFSGLVAYLNADQ